jgi:hypothetical protein
MRRRCGKTLLAEFTLSAAEGLVVTVGSGVRMRCTGESSLSY